MSNSFVEQTTKGSQALKPNFETNIRHTEVGRAQQFLRLLDPAFDEILMRRLIKRLAKQSEEVIARETSFAGNLIKVERQVVAEIDKLARTIESLKHFRGLF